VLSLVPHLRLVRALEQGLNLVVRPTRPDGIHAQSPVLNGVAALRMAGSMRVTELVTPRMPVEVMAQGIPVLSPDIGDTMSSSPPVKWGGYFRPGTWIPWPNG
jgi:hypothetical protein